VCALTLNGHIPVSAHARDGGGGGGAVGAEDPVARVHGGRHGVVEMHQLPHAQLAPLSDQLPTGKLSVSQGSLTDA